MNAISQPIAVLFGYKSGYNHMIFVGRNGDINFEMLKHRENLIRILALCDGRRTISQIRQKVRSPSDKDFQGLIDLAEEFGIIRDSRELYSNFHEDSANPSAFVRSMSPDEASALAENRDEVPQSARGILLTGSSSSSMLLNLCSKRKSVRAFNGEPLTLEHVSGLLRAMYTHGQVRSTPSAGKLYPLDIYIAVLAQDSNSLAKGLYRYDPMRMIVNPVEDTVITPDRIGHTLNSDQADHAALVVFIAADLERPAAKYANCGYRFALIEAGHAAQNAHLYCAETVGLGMVEYGGFNDQLSAELLGLDYPKRAVLQTIVVGKRGEYSELGKSHMATAWDLSHHLVGENRPIEYVTVYQPNDGQYKIPRVVVEAKYRALTDEMAESECFGCGLAVTNDEAMIKALAEAYERYASGIMRTDVISPATELGKTAWLDPRKIVPLRPFAYQHDGLAEFDPSLNWQWVSGKRHSSGETVMVPVDLVFYPLTKTQLGRVPCYSCSSSGVAAHTDQGVASEKALLELIERDAVSVTWYAKRKITALPKAILPDDIQLRMNHWTRKGWEVKFLNLTLDSAPVVLAIIYSPKRYPCFIAGAAASLNWNTAIIKAWDEAELLLLNLRHGKREKPLQPQEVRSPLDHGRMYYRGENLSQVKWLLDAEELEVTAPSIREGSELLKLFNPVLLDLTPAESGCELKIVRAISESLLPINFGYGNEHVGHRRLSDLGLEWKREFPSFPHFFA